MLHVLLNLGHVHFQVFISLELGLNRNNIFGVPDLAVMNGFEIFLELVELGAELFPFSLDARETLLRVGVRSDGELALDFFEFGPVWPAERCQVLCCQATVWLLLEVFHAGRTRPANVRWLPAFAAATCGLRRGLLASIGAASCQATGETDARLSAAAANVAAGTRAGRRAELAARLARVLSRLAASWFGLTARLLARNALLEPLVVHVEVAHGLFFRATWHSFELRLEGLVVDFQLILDLLLLAHQILRTERTQVLSLDFLRIKPKFRACCLVLDLGFDHEPGAEWVITDDLASGQSRHRVQVGRHLGEARFARDLTLVLAHLA